MSYKHFQIWLFSFDREGGSKVKSDHIKRLPAHDCLQVGFTLQTSRTKNKRVISTFKFCYLCLNLKGGSRVFQNEPKNIPCKDFVMRNISCEFEISTYNTLCPRGPTKLLAESRKKHRGGHLVFQKEAKNTPRQDFMVMNISCKLEKACYNLFFLFCFLFC